MWHCQVISKKKEKKKEKGDFDKKEFENFSYKHPYIKNGN